MKLILLFLISFFTLSCMHTKSNNSFLSEKQIKDFRTNPRWIEMMNDSTVNYNIAKAAFEEFWKGKPSPESLMEGEDEKEEGEKRSLISRIAKSDKKYKQEILQYTEDYKKFTFWLQDNQGFVKEDGTLMSESEKQALIQQELLNRQNNK